MTKWFDTNYHYLVPEFTADQAFRLASTKAVQEYREAKAPGIETRPVLLGPVSYLLLGKTRGADFDPLSLLPRLLPVYAELLGCLAEAVRPGCRSMSRVWSWTSMKRLAPVWRRLCGAGRTSSASPEIMLTTYFGGLADNLSTALALPVPGLHLDLVRAPEQLEAVLTGARPVSCFARRY